MTHIVGRQIATDSDISRQLTDTRQMTLCLGEVGQLLPMWSTAHVTVLLVLYATHILGISIHSGISISLSWVATEAQGTVKVGVEVTPTGMLLVTTSGDDQ